jgi:nucleoside-diphosphate-sugar epimerase
MAPADIKATASRPKALVIGGAGFLGLHIVRQLLESGEYNVAVFDQERAARGTAAACSDLPASVEYREGDIRTPSQVIDACEGAEVVFLCATARPRDGSRPKQDAVMESIHVANLEDDELMRAVNIAGTTSVIDACVQCKVKKLIYTSCASGELSLLPRP